MRCLAVAAVTVEARLAGRWLARGIAGGGLPILGLSLQLSFGWILPRAVDADVFSWGRVSPMQVFALNSGLKFRTQHDVNAVDPEEESTLCSSKKICGW
jgi:hypothetical protein